LLVLITQVYESCSLVVVVYKTVWCLWRENWGQCRAAFCSTSATWKSQNTARVVARTSVVIWRKVNQQISYCYVTTHSLFG